jgi:hypothetical protein
MSEGTHIIVGPEVSARLDQLHALYGRDQSLPHILDASPARANYTAPDGRFR